MHRLATVCSALLFFACPSKQTQQLRERYCAQVDQSRLSVDARLKLALLTLEQQTALAGALTEAAEERSSELLWNRANGCSLFAQHWGEAVGASAAMQADWYEVRLASGDLVIDPPGPLQTPREAENVCVGRGALGSTWKEATRDAADRLVASTAAAKAERDRWVTSRDAALARCVAAGWKRPDSRAQE